MKDTKSTSWTMMTGKQYNKQKLSYTHLQEGTKYHTLPLVLAMITHVIQHAAKPYLSKPGTLEIHLMTLHQMCNLLGQHLLMISVTDGWITGLRHLFVISTLLDPQFIKSFDFPLHGGRACAMRLLWAEWCIWKAVGSVALPPIIVTSKVPVVCLTAFFLKIKLSY